MSEAVHASAFDFQTFFYFFLIFLEYLRTIFIFAFRFNK